MTTELSCSYSVPVEKFGYEKDFSFRPFQNKLDQYTTLHLVDPTFSLKTTL